MRGANDIELGPGGESAGSQRSAPEAPFLADGVGRVSMSYSSTSSQESTSGPTRG